jgi:hypothetical protein
MAPQILVGVFFKGPLKKKVKKGQSEVQSSSSDEKKKVGGPHPWGGPWEISHLVIWPVRSCPWMLVILENHRGTLRNQYFIYKRKSTQKIKQIG